VELPGPDDEVVRWVARLQTALTAAATTDGDIGPAIRIADDMIARGLQRGPRGQVLAASLIDLSHHHLRDKPGQPEPYRPLKDRLLAQGLITEDNVSAALHGWELAVGLQQGWLPAALYDELIAFGGADPQVRELMTHIQRHPDDQAPAAAPTGGKP
jgi:hypothetical protein